MGFLKFPSPILFSGEARVPITAATTGTTMANYGISTITSTAALKTYTLALPTKGVVKTIICTNATTGLVARVGLGAASVFSSAGSGTTKDTLRFTRADQTITLIGLSSSRWAMLPAPTAVTVATS